MKKYDNNVVDSWSYDPSTWLNGITLSLRKWKSSMVQNWEVQKNECVCGKGGINIPPDHRTRLWATKDYFHSKQFAVKISDELPLTLFEKSK